MTKPFEPIHAPKPKPPALDDVDRSLDRIITASLAGVVLVAPWFMGGRHPLGQLVLVLLAVSGALAWGATVWRRSEPLSWKLTPAHGLLLAAVALVGLQLLPLPEPLLHCLSPQLRRLLPLWHEPNTGPASFERWSSVSVIPAETRSSLVMLLAYGLLFCVAIQHLRTVDKVERLLRWLASSVVLVAIVGLVQYLFGNGRFLWIYEHPYRTAAGVALGPFANANHFAHLLALGVGPLVWLLQRSIHAHREARRMAGQWPACETAATGWTLWWRLLALGLVLLAGLMTFSRSGVAMMFLAAAVSAGLMFHAGLLGRWVLRSLGVIFLLIGVCLAVHGYQRDSERLGDFAGGSLEKLIKDGARSKIWLADMRALGDFWVLGSGAGSHREVYPRYLTEPRPIEFRHVENGYLQVALETGLPGLALLLGGVAWCLSRCYVALRKPCSPRVYDCTTAVAAGLLVSAAHSLMDFVWFVPACMAVTTLLAACAMRLSQFTSEAAAKSPSWKLPLTRRRLAMAALALMMTAFWMVDDRSRAVMAAPHWEAHLRLARANRGTSATPDENDVKNLEQVIAWTPNDARAHLRLAAALLARCEWLPRESRSVLALSHASVADLTAKGATAEELAAWFERVAAVHGNELAQVQRHARRAVELSPLDGEGYIYLAELSFLADEGREARSAYVDQAMHVRPYDPSVLLAAGNEAALAGDLNVAMDRWLTVFNTGADEREQLVTLLIANRVPIELVLERFRPELEALRVLDAKYGQALSADALEPLLRYYLKVGQATAGRLGEEEAAPLWAELADIHKRMAEPAKALKCLRRAAAGRPNDYSLRFTLATRLCDEREFAEAEMHLKWCLQRHPEDEQLQSTLMVATRRRAEIESPTPAALR